MRLYKEEWSMILYAKLAESYEDELEKLNSLLVKGAVAEVRDGKLVIVYDEEEVKSAKSRNAGRKKADAKWIESYNTFCDLYKSHKSIKEIMAVTGFSRATCYRYKSQYDITESIYEEYKASLEKLTEYRNRITCLEKFSSTY